MILERPSQASTLHTLSVQEAGENHSQRGHTQTAAPLLRAPPPLPVVIITVTAPDHCNGRHAYKLYYSFLGTLHVIGRPMNPSRELAMYPATEPFNTCNRAHMCVW
jgi:hypothetical protein